MPIRDRLSVDVTSPYYDAYDIHFTDVVTLNGEVQTTCTEYCISEGWLTRFINMSVDLSEETLHGDVVVTRKIAT